MKEVWTDEENRSDQSNSVPHESTTKNTENTHRKFPNDEGQTAATPTADILDVEAERAKFRGYEVSYDIEFEGDDIRVTPREGRSRSQSRNENRSQSDNRNESRSRSGNRNENRSQSRNKSENRSQSRNRNGNSDRNETRQDEATLSTTSNTSGSPSKRRSDGVTKNAWGNADNRKLNGNHVEGKKTKKTSRITKRRNLKDMSKFI